MSCCWNVSCHISHDMCLHAGSNCELVTSYCLASGGNPCKNGATCRNGDRTYACDCVPGFTGESQDNS